MPKSRLKKCGDFFLLSKITHLFSFLKVIFFHSWIIIHSQHNPKQSGSGSVSETQVSYQDLRPRTVIYKLWIPRSGSLYTFRTLQIFFSLTKETITMHDFAKCCGSGIRIRDGKKIRIRDRKQSESGTQNHFDTGSGMEKF
jgi:hypothetical protein